MQSQSSIVFLSQLQLSQLLAAVQLPPHPPALRVQPFLQSLPKQPALAQSEMNKLIPSVPIARNARINQRELNIRKPLSVKHFKQKFTIQLHPCNRRDSMTNKMTFIANPQNNFFTSLSTAPRSGKRSRVDEPQRDSVRFPD
jgi:hypothetical protein